MRRIMLVAALVLGVQGPAQASLDSGIATFQDRAYSAAADDPLRLAQESLALIVAPERIDTDQDTVDFTGRAMAPGEVTLTVNGLPVAVAADGSFRIRQQVPVGRSRFLLVVEGSYGDKAEPKVFVRRTAAATKATEYGRFHALVIGNNEYITLTDLEMASADAEAVATILRERYGFEVEILIDAKRYDIISALARKRAQLTENDNLLIYYAGHGNLDIGSDEGFWLPIDAEADNPANWLSNNDITGQLRAMRAKHVLVVADSCYSGKLTRNIEAHLKTGAERAAWLARMNGRRSRTALTSGGLEPVLDAGGGAHSVFAQAFLETLRSNTQVLDGQALFDAIKRPIVVNADQTPEYADIRKAGHDGGDFLFVPVAAITAAVLQVPPQAAPSAREFDPAIELAYWQAIQGSANPELFESYLQQFPNGSFVPLARFKRDALRETSDAETQTAAIVPPPTPAFAVEEMDTTFVALQTSNVRAEPTTGAARVGRLSRDDAVVVTGKVADRNWYRIEFEGEPAFVFGTLIEAVDPGEIAAWTLVASSSNSADFEAFIGEFPNGFFAARARSKLNALTPVAPPSEPEPSSLDLAFWESVRDSTNPAAYEAYLQQFPNGDFASLARTRLSAAEAERRAAEEAKRKEAERKEAERKAQQETQTALLTPPPQTAVSLSEEEILADPAVGQAITKFYTKSKIQRQCATSPNFLTSKMTSITGMKVLEISGSTITIKVEYGWKTDCTKSYDQSIARLEKVGSSYTV